MKRSFMSRLAAVGLLALATPCGAAVTVTGESASRITVDVQEATVVAVLEGLREKFAFELGGVEKVKGSEALSLTLTGSLSEVLARLLRNWNYVIVSSPDSSGGIEKVVILNAAHGAAAPAPPPKSEDAAADQTEQTTGN